MKPRTYEAFCWILDNLGVTVKDEMRRAAEKIVNEARIQMPEDMLIDADMSAVIEMLSRSGSND